MTCISGGGMVICSRGRKIKRESLPAIVEALKEVNKENHMSIEKTFERIADALEGLLAVAQQGGNTVEETPKKTTKATTAKAAAPAAAAAAAPAVAAAAAGTTAPTPDDLADMLRELVGAKGAPAAKTILGQFGADRISAVPAEKHQAFYDAMKKAKDA